ncbi:ZIP zinc transporter-domain-containing protein [Geopyxis carbonaria]|nr:ZIP zinc transporter-domain-containing protein [Geopyxis carbonaria]
MADGLLTVLLFSVIMAIASFSAGLLPLSVSLSQPQLRLLSTVGMGVLVGTALVVIIPEGVETLYSAQAAAVAVVGAPPVGGNGGVGVVVPVPVGAGAGVDERALWVRDDTPTPDTPSTPAPETPSTPDTPHDDEHGHDDDHHDDAHAPASPHKYIGLCLISGFILMYLLDALPSALPSSSTSSRSEPYHISLDSLHSSLSPSPPTGRTATSTTLGLVVHAAADGIALGASSSSAALSTVVFFAILLHKMPAAFGLTAVLLRSGLGRRAVRAHLLVFSGAAPAGALVTWALVRALGVGAGGMQWWTGALLLFSGGTFLYVAMHTMLEHAGEKGARGGGGGVGEVVAAVVGMCIPLLTQVGHAHAH